MRFYTGVGSRKAPEDVLKFMSNIALILGSRGYCLRTGRAGGSDSAFIEGSESYAKQIYDPEDCTKASLELAKKFHPAWNRLSDYAKKLHGRNPFQVLGYDLNLPSDFLICWTPDGCSCHEERSIETGGTGTAISIADYYNVPVYNIQRPDHFSSVRKMLKDL